MLAKFKRQFEPFGIAQIMVSMRYASIRTRNFWSIRCTSVWIVGSKTVFTRQTANRWPIDGTSSIWARLWIVIGRCTLFSNMFTHMTVIRTTRRPTVWPKKVHANTDNITTISKRQLDNTNRMRNRDSSEAFSRFNLYKKNQTIIFQHQKKWYTIWYMQFTVCHLLTMSTKRK